jgi:hypothetical protein
LTLTFEIADPRTAHSFGWSDDKRPLGIKLASAVLGSDRIEIPSFNEVEIPSFNQPVRKGLLERLFNRAVTRFRLVSGGSA